MEITQVKTVELTVVTSKGEKRKFSHSENEKWSFLSELLRKEGYDIDKLKAIESKNKTTLEHPDAILPNSNYILFLMPLESKGGAVTKKVAKKAVKKAATKKVVSKKTATKKTTKKEVPIKVKNTKVKIKTAEAIPDKLSTEKVIEPEKSNEELLKEMRDLSKDLKHIKHF